MIFSEVYVVDVVTVMDGGVLSIQFTIAVADHILPIVSTKVNVYAPLSAKVYQVDQLLLVIVVASLNSTLKLTLPLVALPEAGVYTKVGIGGVLSIRKTLPVAIQRLPARS